MIQLRKSSSAASQSLQQFAGASHFRRVWLCPILCLPQAIFRSSMESGHFQMNRELSRGSSPASEECISSATARRWASAEMCPSVPRSAIGSRRIQRLVHGRRAATASRVQKRPFGWVVRRQHVHEESDCPLGMNAGATSLSLGDAPRNGLLERGRAWLRRPRQHQGFESTSDSRLVWRCRPRGGLQAFTDVYPEPRTACGSR